MNNSRRHHGIGILLFLLLYQCSNCTLHFILKYDIEQVRFLQPSDHRTSDLSGVPCIQNIAGARQNPMLSLCFMASLINHVPSLLGGYWLNASHIHASFNFASVSRCINHKVNKVTDPSLTSIQNSVSLIDTPFFFKIIFILL